MEKSIVIKIGGLLLLFIVIGIFLYFVLDSKDTDANRFKDEYENLNGKKNEQGKKYLEIEIDSENNVKYASFDEVMELLDNGTGILYLGFPECPWCRNAVPVLLETAKENEIENIYYFNAEPIRDNKELKDGKVITTKSGTDEYYKLVDKLKGVLNPYDGLNDESIKRIYFPTVIFVMGGKVVGMHEGTTDSQKDVYKKMNEKEEKELKEIYTNNINKMYGTCDEKC